MKTSFNFNIVKATALSLIAFVCLFDANCKAQTGNFSYKPVPGVYLPSISDLAPYRDTANIDRNGAYDLTASLPRGFVTDGSVDYTDYLQSGINNNKKIIFPNFPVLINNKGLTLISNSIIIFQPNSKVILKPNAAGGYQILRLNNIQNVKIYFAVIEGDRKEHLGKTGEWGMGISIAGSSNIQLINPKVNDCWGDGIYLGKLNQPCKDIKIYYPVLDNNRRNGISITSIDGLNIFHAVISNTNGTLPTAAIDFEPNSNTDEINNIYVDKPVTFNSGFGIIIALIKLPGAIRKNVNIVINNHIDDNSRYGFCYSKFNDKYDGYALSGNIKVLNPVWKNNVKSFAYEGYYKYGPNVEFKNASMPKNNSQNANQDDQGKIKGYFNNLNRSNANKVIFH